MFDIIILVLTGVALIVGYSRGIVRQIGSLVAFVAALVACHLFGDAASRWAASVLSVSDSASGGFAASVIGNVVLFVIVWGGLGLVARLIHEAVKAVKLGWLNSILGALFMAFKVIIGISLLINIWLVASPDAAIRSEGGVAVKAVTEAGPMLLGIVRDNF